VNEYGVPITQPCVCLGVKSIDPEYTAHLGRDAQGLYESSHSRAWIEIQFERRLISRGVLAQVSEQFDLNFHVQIPIISG
jgi:hypothetical protein